MTAPKREEVEAFIAALNYGMKVSHKPEFLIALAEGWLKEHDRPKTREEKREQVLKCDHNWVAPGPIDDLNIRAKCSKCPALKLYDR